MAKAQGKVQKQKVFADVDEPMGVADKTFNEVKRHYDDAFNDTDQRKIREGGFDDVDKMHRTYVDPNTWPYQSVIADPRTFTFITEKDARMFANKLRGRMEPREGGDVLGAKINTELLHFQWDNDNYGGTQLQKWAMTSQRTRKYGAGFKLEKWRYEVRNGKCVFDGPSSKALNNADCGPDPSATCIEECNYFQVRDWPTFQDLEAVNDAASTKPNFKNLDKLREAIAAQISKSKGGDRRDTRRQSTSRQLLGLSDAIGDDRVFRTVELVTEYRRDRWITFAPKYGVVLRDIPNPYDNNEIPIVMLKYYPVDDDLYGVSEVEPVMKLFKAINAFLSHGVDEANMKLYTPLKVRANAVRMHTIDYGGVSPKWIMNDPTSDVVPHETSSNNLQQLTQIYSTLVAASQEALGESSLGVSNIPGPVSGEDKTATEVRQVASEQRARDNFNQLYLQEAIQRQMMLWHTMNKKMLISKKDKQGYVVRIVGKDAMEFFQKQSLDGVGLTDEATQLLAENPEMDINGLTTPLYPVNEGEFKQETKFKMDDSGQAGTLVIDDHDLKGNYDYIADVESMALGATENEKQGKDTAIQTILSNALVLQFLQVEGVRPKFKELLVDWLEDKGFKDAEKYFEAVQQQLGGAVDPTTGQPVQGAGVDPSGAGIATQGLPDGGNGQVPGMGAFPQVSGY